MPPFRITHKADNSIYESALSVSYLQGARMLMIGIQDNNGVNVVFGLDSDEMHQLADYLRGLK